MLKIRKIDIEIYSIATEEKSDLSFRTKIISSSCLFKEGSCE